MEWTAQRKSETRVEDKGESEEASAGNESDGRQKEIADETNRRAVEKVARLKPPLDEKWRQINTALTERSGLFCILFAEINVAGCLCSRIFFEKNPFRQATC